MRDVAVMRATAPALMLLAAVALPQPAIGTVIVRFSHGLPNLSFVPQLRL